jgi:hypothetical protein
MSWFHRKKPDPFVNKYVMDRPAMLHDITFHNRECTAAMKKLLDDMQAEIKTRQEMYHKVVVETMRELRAEIEILKSRI